MQSQDSEGILIFLRCRRRLEGPGPFFRRALLDSHPDKKRNTSIFSAIQIIEARKEYKSDQLFFERAGILDDIKRSERVDKPLRRGGLLFRVCRFVFLLWLTMSPDLSGGDHPRRRRSRCDTPTRRN
jgi:hypothetical protein